MKRSQETVRHILKHIDQYDGKGISDEATLYHLKMMRTSEMIDYETLRDGDVVHVIGLTLLEEGYDLLSYITNDYVWEDVKNRIHDKQMDIDDVPTDIIKWLAEEMMKELLGNGSDI